MSTVYSTDQDSKEANDDDMDWSEEARSDGRGWNIELFVKREKASQKLCAQCKNVCFDAVELICSKQNDEDDTDDEHEADYCKSCLSEYFESNDNKCVVCSHPNATMRDVPYIRNKIGRLKIFCPRSNLSNKGNQTLCEWQGTISKLKDHLLNDCKFGLKKCIYCDLGCKYKYIENTQDADSHQKKYMMQHMEMLLKSIVGNNNTNVARNDDNKLVSNMISNLGKKLKGEMDQMMNVVHELKGEMMSIKQRTQNKANESGTEDIINVSNEIDIDPQKVIGRCNKCNVDIKYFENELFNVTFVKKQWQHIDCDYKPQVIEVHNIDQWSDRIKADTVIVNGSRATLCGATGSQNQNFCGVITVKFGDDTKQWKVRINHLGAAATAYIGIINKYKIHQSLVGNDAYKYGLSLGADGDVYCFDKERFKTSKPFAQGDIITIVLDITNNILLFKVNADCVMVPVTNLNINLRNKEWKLFGSLRNEGDEMMIVSEDAVFDDIKHENDEMDDAKETELGYLCNICNETLSNRDFDLNNAEWSAINYCWKHVDCKLSGYQLPDLSDSNKNRDQFNKLLAAKSMLVSDDYSFTNNKSSVYQSVFGVMSITKGIKIWNIRIDHGSSNMYIGIIETDKMNNVSRNAIPNNGAYRITNNGTLSGGGLNLTSSVSFKSADTLTIILDMDKGILSFGNSNKQYAVASGADIKDKSFNLFVTTYNINDSVTIICDYEDEGVEIKAEVADRGKTVDTCVKCNKTIYELDFDRNNVEWNEDNSKWQHKLCNVDQTVPQLKLHDRDVWHPFFTNPGIQICNKTTVVGGNTSVYYNSFGVIKVNSGVKKWNVRINVQPSYAYIGVIRSHLMKRKKTGVPSAEGYYLQFNGTIAGASLSIQQGTTLQAGDIVNIILDKTKNTLCFGVNNGGFTYAKGAMLQNSSFNLFCTSYYPNTSFTILGAHENDEEDVKEDFAPIGKCSKCNKVIYEDELKIDNISFDDKQNKWNHKNCSYTKPKIVIPKLGLKDIDQWHRRLSHPAMVFSVPYTFIGGKSCYTNAFGVITVSEGVKTWELKINSQPSMMYIGVIDAKYVKNKISGLPSNGYYLGYNGNIKGGSSFNSGYTFKAQDRVKIILDMNEDTLCFAINGKNFMYVKGAVLKGRSFKLFCTTYYAASSVTILGKDSGANKGITKGRALYSCSKCGQQIYEFDFDINNAKNTSNRWHHIECNFNIPNLSQNQRDEWNRMVSNRNVTISKYEATATVGSQYLNAFGIISVADGKKQWNVKIVAGATSYMSIGIVDSSGAIARSNAVPINSYYLHYNGYIQGSGLSINTGNTFTTNDVINVHLDVANDVLSFGKNNGNFAIAKDANIKGRSFNLFCTMYYQNNKVTIQ